jgi:hypothetical protein
MLRVAEDYAAGHLAHGQMLAANEQARREAGRAQARIARTTRQTALVDLLTAAGTAHPRRAIQRTWNNLQLADRRDVIRALMTVTIERAGRGYAFQPSQVRIAFKKTRVSIPGSA